LCLQLRAQESAGTVQPLRIRFVPITLAQNDNATGDVTPRNIEDYGKRVHQLLPAGNVIATIRTPLSTETSFGVAPAGGDMYDGENTDLMSYCWPPWISAYTWNAVLR
jgi:hypothetical protein